MKRLSVVVALTLMLLGSAQAADQEPDARQARQDRYLELQERLASQMEAKLAERLAFDRLCGGRVARSMAKESPACNQAGLDQLLAADRRD